jgi:hypothetical protein
MGAPANYKGIEEVLRDGKRFHVISCACPGCDNTIEIALSNGRRKPPKILCNMAQRRG